MHRPCFLVIDREFPASISTRKLVIETAKFNVITAYSGKEAFDLLERFPAVDAVVLDAAIEDVRCIEAIRHFKERSPDLPVVVIQSLNSPHCEGADFYLDSFEPHSLLKTLRNLDPQSTREVVDGEEAAELEHS